MSAVLFRPQYKQTRSGPQPAHYTYQHMFDTSITLKLAQRGFFMGRHWVIININITGMIAMRSDTPNTHQSAYVGDTCGPIY